MQLRQNEYTKEGGNGIYIKIHGTEYKLHQCETDLFEWIEWCKQHEGQYYTHYYDKLAYHAQKGLFRACYADNHDNWWTI